MYLYCIELILILFLNLFYKIGCDIVSQETLTLADSVLPKVRIHPIAIFSILNHFARRTPRDSRVIGTLLGEVKDGVVVVSVRERDTDI